MLNNQKLKEFLYSLFGQCTDCKLSIMTLPDKQIRHYLPEQLDQLIADGQRLGAVCNTYFDVNLERKKSVEPIIIEKYWTASVRGYIDVYRRTSFRRLINPLGFVIYSYFQSEIED